MTIQLCPMQPTSGLVVTDHLSLPNFLHIVWGRVGKSFIYKYCVWTQHTSHKPLMIETKSVTQMLDTTSVLLWLIAQNPFIIYCHCESFKSYNYHCSYSDVQYHSYSLIYGSYDLWDTRALCPQG
jgi:hypothetical protein